MKRALAALALVVASGCAATTPDPGRSSLVDALSTLRLPRGASLRFGSDRLRLGGPLTSVSFTPDGKRLLVGGRDRSVALFDVGTGERVRLFGGGVEGSTLTAISPDGRFVASSRADGGLRVWDADDGRLVREMATLHFPNGLRFSADGAILAVRSANAIARYHTSDWTSVTEPPEPAGVAAFAFADEGRMLWVSRATRGRGLWIWERGDLHEPPVVVEEPTMPVLFELSGDRKTLLVLTPSLEARLFDVATGALVKALPTATTPEGGTHPLLRAVAIAHDGGLVALADDEHGVVIHARESTKLRSFEIGASVHDLAFSPDGTLLAVATASPLVRLFRVATGQQLIEEPGHSAAVRALVVSRDGSRLVSAGDDATVRVWDARTARSLLTVNTKRPIAALGLLPSGSRVVFDGTGLASQSDARELAVLDLTTNALTFSSPEPARATSGILSPSSPIVGFAVAPNGKSMAVLSGITATLWDLPSVEPSKVWFGFDQGGPRAAIFSRSSRELFVGASFTTKVELGEVGLRTDWEGHKGATLALDASPDGATIATGGADGVFRIWLTETGRTLRLGRHADGADLRARAVTAVRFSPDGRVLATAGEDRSVRLWDTATLHPLRVLSGHAGGVTAIAFAPDGGTLYSAGEDATILAWSLDAPAPSAAP